MTIPPERPASGADGRPTTVRSADSVSRQALEDILKQTAALNALTQSGDQATLELLLQVARQFRGFEFQLDPVLTELVRVSIRQHPGLVFGSEEQFEAIVNRVAQALFENPDSHARLNSFWQQLMTVE